MTREGTREGGGVVLACDIDDTLLATNSRSPSERTSSADALRELRAAIRHDRLMGRRVYFGSATGRSHVSHREREAESPAFIAATTIMDFKITSVGSEIWLRNGADFDFAPLADWPNAPGWDRTKALAALAGRAELTIQPAIAQGAHKLSFDVEGATDDAQSSYAEEIARWLAAHDVSAQVIFSGGLFLDILPEGVNKGTALLHTVGALSLQGVAEPGQEPLLTIAADDSMNGRDLLLAADRAILPGNAHDSLREWAQATIPPEDLYLAEGNFAAGVLEGYQHFTQPR